MCSSDLSVGGMTLDDEEEERGAYLAAKSSSPSIFDEDSPAPGDARVDDSEERGDIFDVPDVFIEEKDALSEGLSLVGDAAGDEEGD